jgi:hypothetical protein
MPEDPNGSASTERSRGGQRNGRDAFHTVRIVEKEFFVENTNPGDVLVCIPGNERCDSSKTESAQSVSMPTLAANFQIAFHSSV